ncbi:ParB/RepB/Spo0J family partition protein [Qaidamihabitans albus]|uniref:ParB/RepB/Spo0J family partition protein n=1 Tax=Qaidamihabitans albus TaxID=2795733 RepID=UPI0018F21401|nr:ParB/RepB/Spo0J family partition protein [Qaidamihabitans albus]
MLAELGRDCGDLLGPVEFVPIHTLRPADSPRLSGEDNQHAEVLAELGERVPPIIVHRASMRVVDGMHRLRAAVIRQEDHIRVRFFDGEEVDAFRLAVTLNVMHGLPLTLADRRAAASRILKAQPHLSDRSIARTAGLSPKTVGSLRQQVLGDQDQSKRVGKDGRVRPANIAQGRRIASMLFAERPNASLREVARSAGISPATARDVRARLDRDDDPVPARLREAEQSWRSVPEEPHENSVDQDGFAPADPKDREMPRVRPTTVTPVEFEGARRTRDPAATLATLSRDPRLRLTQSGRAMLVWFRSHVVNPVECESLVRTVPDHLTGRVAQLAREVAAAWIALANQLEDSAAREAALAATHEKSEKAL